MKRTLAHLMVDYLERRGVEFVFGLCGHTNIAFLDALKDSSKIRFISVRHEQIAATAADGYARVKGKTGVVLTHLGPGLTNAVTGVANAAMDSVPMVVIAGDVPSYYYGRHPHQEFNMHSDASQYEIYRPFVKRAWRLERADLAPQILDRAFRLAESGRPGPTLISVPMDLFSEHVDESLFERTYRDSGCTRPPAISRETALAIAKALIEAERPVIHVGGGVLAARATEQLQELAEHLSIPVSRTLMGQGAMSDLHPLMLGMTGFWGTKFTNSMTANADLILALGTRFAEADSSSWYEGVTFSNKSRVIQVDIDVAEIGRNYPVEIGAVADLKEALIAICAAVKELHPQPRENKALIERIEQEKRAFAESNRDISADGRFPMTPQRILQDVRRLMPEDGLIFTDVGWNKNGVGQQFPVTRPGTIHHPSGLATMGFGPAAVLGAKLAAPDRKVVTLVGDGGFGANPSVLATAVEQGIAVVWVVMNNMAFGTIAGLEKAHYGTTFGTTFAANGQPYSPEWAEIARGYGIKARKVTAADEFAQFFAEALQSDEPFLIDCPMENIPVPTEGAWNINDIYTPKDNIVAGRKKGEPT